MYDIAIIGCGVIGAALAYELSKYELNIVVLEKENDVSCGTTKANSAIIHAGYDPEPGTLMALLDAKGNRLCKEIFEKLDVPHKNCGSFVLAFDDNDVKTLDRLKEKGDINGVRTEIWDRDRVLSLEPNLNPHIKAALYAPDAMITSPWEFALALAECAVNNGVTLRLGHEVLDIDKSGDFYSIKTNNGEVKASVIFNAAGLYADKIHAMVKEPTFTITPRKGEYYLLDKSEGTVVNSVIFQCPTAEGKGVLVAPTVHGNLIVGPSNEDVDSPNNLSNTAEGLDFVLNSAEKSVPNLNLRANIRNFSGNRARSTRRDFIIEESDKNFFDLAGIDSPGLSSAPAIAVYAVELLEKNRNLIKKTDFKEKRKLIRFEGLSQEEKAELITQNPLYGRIICRCEIITEGEIRDTFKTPIPPKSIDGVKRRVGAGSGRCQGGFCGPRVLEILAEELNINPTEVLQDSHNTYILTKETKEI